MSQHVSQSGILQMWAGRPGRTKQRRATLATQQGSPASRSVPVAAAGWPWGETPHTD